MKKISISLFAILAIVFATTAAFTKVDIKKPFAAGWRLAVNPVTPAAPGDSGDYESGLAPNQPPASGDCGGNLLQICAAHFNSSDEIDSDDYVLGGIQ